LDPKVLSKIARLDLRARTVVEGFLSGRHRSPYHGVSVEFAEHREYVPGDDLRHLDWKVYGRTDRYYIKRYEEETSLTCHLIVDGSASMLYAGEGGVSKFDYAATAAAALAYLVLRQQDFAGLAVFDERIRSFVPASNNPAHLQVLAHELAHVKHRDILIGTVAASIASAIMFIASMARWAAIFGGGRSDDRDGGFNPIGLLVAAVVAPVAALLIQMAISRSREYAADAGGAAYAGNPYGLAEALKKLDAWSKRVPLQASPATSHMFIVKPFTGGGLFSLFSTHPPIPKRIERLMGMRG